MGNKEKSEVVTTIKTDPKTDTSLGNSNGSGGTTAIGTSSGNGGGGSGVTTPSSNTVTSSATSTPDTTAETVNGKTNIVNKLIKCESEPLNVNMCSANAMTPTDKKNSAELVNTPSAVNVGTTDSIVKQGSPVVQHNTPINVNDGSLLLNDGSNQLANQSRMVNLPNDMTPSTMEAQYMQQQSQIFVFSTQLANKAAEAVMQGQFPSIIACHCAQPGTKSILEKHPLKIQQFNRQNPAMCPAAVVAASAAGAMGMGNEHFGPGGGPNGAWMMNSMGGQQPSVMNSLSPVDTSPWGVQNQRPQSQQGNPNFNPMGSPVIPMDNALDPSMMGPPIRPQLQGQGSYMMGMGSGQGQPTQQQFAMMHQARQNNMMNDHMNAMGQPTLTGVKVPDENLTPQQRQHREEQLAIIRNIHEMFLKIPDQHQGSPMPPECGMMGNQQQVMGNQNSNNAMAAQNQPGQMGMCPQQQQRIPSMMVGSNSNSFPPHPSMGMVSPGPSSVDGSHQGYCPGSPMGMNPHSQQGSSPRMMVPQQQQQQHMQGPGMPLTNSAQMEWQRLQNQFYEDKKRQRCDPNPSLMNVNHRFGGPQQPQQQQQQQCPTLNSTSGGGLIGANNGGGNGPQLPPSSTGPVNTKLPGPPPPYHQPQRSCSGNSGITGGGGAMASPAPPSPNPNSSLSVPSPRMSSGISSPADATPRSYSAASNPRLPHPSPSSLHNTPMNSPTPRPINPSTPGTPASVGGTTLPSPGLQRKQRNTTAPEYSPQPTGGPSTPMANQPQPAEGMFGRTLQSYAQSQQRQQQQQLVPPGAQSSPKEPNLMPVPSPQQIQYLNAFDGQELTIQKQPNTSLQEQQQLLSPNGVSQMKDAGTKMNFGGGVGAMPNQKPPPNVLQNDSFPGSASQSPIDHVQRFPTPSSHMMAAGGSPNDVRFHMGPSPNMGMNNPLEMMNQRFNPCGNDSLNKYGPRGIMMEQQQRFANPRMMGTDGMTGGRFASLDHANQRFPQGSGPSGMLPTGPNRPNSDFSPPHSVSTAGGYSQLSPDKMCSDIGTHELMDSTGLCISPNHLQGPRLSHFDPISSMAQMSQSLAASNVSGGPGGGVQRPAGPNQGPVVNFQTDIHTMQGVQQSGMMPQGMQQGPGSMGMHHPQEHMMNQLGQNMGPQTVNNTYVNATMSIQQLNIQNMGAPTSYNPAIQVQQQSMTSPHPSMMNQMPINNQGSSPPAINQMNTNVSPKTVMNPVGQRMAGQGQFQMQGGAGTPPRMGSPIGVRGPTGQSAAVNMPYNGANVQVKASAPNTINYLPSVRTQNTSNAPPRPPSLDFLPRFTGQNMQQAYFGQQPNQNMNMRMAGMNMGGHPGSPSMVGGGNPQVGCMPRGQTSGGNMRPTGMGGPQGMGGANVGGGQMYGMYSSGPVENPIPQQMYDRGGVVGPKGQMMMAGGGGPIDTAEIGGPSPTTPNFKQSPYLGPTTADPSYALQFHNFQQQFNSEEAAV
ncbi:hypothetical protein CHUAL_007579 [Chamberlinius hualienensis]